MKKYPSISIAIPTFNEEGNIKRCLDSIFQQKYKGKLEIFIVDAASKDKTVDIAQKYPVKILNNSKKYGEYGKMIALRKSTGKYFLYLDADIDLPTKEWFNKMIVPLEQNSKIVGSFTGYVAYPDDKPLNKYITLDFLQRDPLFSWLTTSLSSVAVDKRKEYVICEYTKDKVLPAGLCIYRRKEILATEIGKREKFNELDNLVILQRLGKRRFAYVPGAKLHHPFISSFWTLIKKRRRNIFTMYFDQPNERLWTWVNWNSPYDIIKLILWVLYANSIIMPLLVGAYKSLYHRTLVGFYEPVFDLIETDVIVFSFMQKVIKRYGVRI